MLCALPSAVALVVADSAEGDIVRFGFDKQEELERKTWS